MTANKHFIKFKEISVDGPRPFEEIVTKTIPSVISLALGGEDAESPSQFFGTAFGISLNHENEPTNVFLTCSHVFDNLQAEMNETRDKIKFISLFSNGRFIWEKVETIKRIEPYKMVGDFAETHDISLCRIPGINAPPLTLSDNNYLYGEEVGLLGFPNYEHLQKLDPQPFVLKTVISGMVIYPLETGNGQTKADRLALGCVTGHGFSGSPVFLIENTANIVGMHDYAPIDGEYPGGVSFAIPSMRLRQAIDIIQEHSDACEVRTFLR
jgi:S1-C subfamily serine protease